MTFDIPEKNKAGSKGNSPFAAFFLFLFFFGACTIPAAMAIDLSEVNALEAKAAAEAAEAQRKADEEAKAAAEAQALRDKISAKNAELSKIQNEIDTYQKWLDSAQDQSKTLQGAIKTLDVERKKMTASIQKTQNQITGTALVIEDLDDTITLTEKKITQDLSAIREIIRGMEQADSRSLLEIVLSKDKFSDILDEATQLSAIRGKISDRLDALRANKETLTEKKTQKEAEGKKLASYKNSLVDQKSILDSAKAEKNNVLTATRNRESAYQKILNENLAKKEAFEAELASYESQLTKQLDVKLIPKPRSLSMLWPVTNPFITQKFGVTKDSVRLYASGTHNGIDLRASVGTAITSPAPGVVVGTGDTDAACPKASYGKWVLVRHDNGLTTLLAHFSLIKVSEGQTVEAGDLLGYSGNTGYSTGPHLHVSLFVSDGVTVGTLPSKSCSNRSFRIPLPTANPPYLDPAAYFPAL